MNTQKKSFPKFLFLVSVATIVSFLTLIFSSPFLRVLRNQYGAKKYWLSGLFVFGGLLSLDRGFLVNAALVFSQWIVIGVYQEFEERGMSGFKALLGAIISGAAFAYFSISGGDQFFNLNFVDSLRQGFSDSLPQIFSNLNEKETNQILDQIIRLVPGMLLSLEVLSLAFALMWDRKAARLMGFSYENISTRMKLMDFRMPDMAIWITMVSFLLSFIGGVPESIKVASQIVVMVCATAYLFQGLAVIEFLFLFLRLSPFTRALIYFIIIGQLFFLLSIVGLIDFWLDFRLRLKRWSYSKNNHNDGENI